MSLIDWPPICSDLRRVPAQVFEALGAIVVQVAQRLELACYEQVPIALMRHNVVDNGCDRGHTILCTHAAERFMCELQLAQALPSAGLVVRQPLTRTASRTAHCIAVICRHFPQDEAGDARAALSKASQSGLKPSSSNQVLESQGHFPLRGGLNSSTAYGSRRSITTATIA